MNWDVNQISLLLQGKAMAPGYTLLCVIYKLVSLVKMILTVVVLQESLVFRT